MSKNTSQVERCTDCNCFINEEPHAETCDILYQSWLKKMRDYHRDWLDAKATVERFRNSRIKAGLSS